jgi:hypothetical protein
MDSSPLNDPTLGISSAHEPSMMRNSLIARPLHAVVRLRASLKNICFPQAGFFKEGLIGYAVKYHLPVVEPP